jgi:hypothetical protein
MKRMRHLPPLTLAIALLLPACGDDSPNGGGGGGSNTAQVDCRVRFAMTGGELTGEFQSIFDYSRAPGHFFGVNTGVECERLDARAAVYGANQCTGRDGACRGHDRSEMYVVAQTTQPLSAPLDLLECRFVGSHPPVVEQFALVATYSTDADGAIVEPPPTVAVTGVACTGPETTTTTLPLPDPCEDVSCSMGESCVDGDCIETNRYVVEFHTDVESSYASLQVDIFYDCSDGRFDGLGDAVACRPAPEINAYAAFNNTGCLADGEESRVTAGAISLLGWPGPGPFVSCEYTSAAGVPPTADSFRIEVADAGTIDDKPIKNAGVSVGAVRAIAP